MLSRTIAIWRPCAEPGGYGRAVLNRLAILDNQRASAVDRNVSVRLDHALNAAKWTSAADAQCFHSELRLAFKCLLAMKGGRLEKPARLRSTRSETLRSAE